MRDEPRVGLLNRVANDLEYRWWAARRPVYFVEDPDLVRKVYDLGLDVRIEELVPPEPVISFSFPTGIVLEGRRLEPCLFGCVRHTSEPDPRTHPLSMFYRLGPVNAHTRVSVLLRAKGPGREGRQDLTSVTTDRDFQILLNDGAPVGPSDLVSPYVTPLEDENRRRVALHMRLCVGFCLYMRVFPEAVREGWPEGARNREMRHWQNAGIRVRRTLVTVPRLRGEVSPHRRRGHFRHLRDERFKRNPDGSIRVIYVEETVVGRDRYDPRIVDAAEPEDAS